MVMAHARNCISKQEFSLGMTAVSPGGAVMVTGILTVLERSVCG